MEKNILLKLKLKNQSELKEKIEPFKTSKNLTHNLSSLEKL